MGSDGYVVNTIIRSMLAVIEVKAAYYFYDNLDVSETVATYIFWGYIALAILLIRKTYDDYIQVVKDHPSPSFAFGWGVLISESMCLIYQLATFVQYAFHIGMMDVPAEQIVATICMMMLQIVCSAITGFCFAFSVHKVIMVKHEDFPDDISKHGQKQNDGKTYSHVAATDIEITCKM